MCDQNPQLVISSSLWMASFLVPEGFIFLNPLGHQICRIVSSFLCLCEHLGFILKLYCTELLLSLLLLLLLLF